MIVDGGFDFLNLHNLKNSHKEKNKEICTIEIKIVKFSDIILRKIIRRKNDEINLKIKFFDLITAKPSLSINIIL